MTSVEIEYCVPCGHLGNAIATQKALLEKHGQDLEGVRLKTGAGGVFKVSVDGDLVYDKEKEGYDLGAILARVAQRVAPGQTA